MSVYRPNGNAPSKVHHGNVNDKPVSLGGYAGCKRNESQLINEVAKKALDDFVEESFVSRFIARAIHGWRVLTLTISGLFQRIFALFTSAVKEDHLPELPQVNVDTHLYLIGRSALSGESAKDLGVPSTNSDPIPTKDEPTSNDRQLIDQGLLEMPATAKTDEDADIEDVDIIETLFYPIAELQQAVKDLQLESYADLRRAIELANEFEQQKEVLLDIVGTMDQSTSVQHREEANVLAEVLKATAFILHKKVLDNQQMLKSLLHSAVEDEDLFACAELMWRNGVITEDDVADMTDNEPKVRATGLAALDVRQANPVGLVNRGRNACYRNAVNQMLAIPYFLQLASTQFQGAADGVGKALLDLWGCQYSPNPDPAHLWHYDEKLLNELRRSPAGYALDLAEDRYRQQDAAAYLATIFQEWEYNMPLKTMLDGLDGKTFSENVVEESAILSLGRFDTIEEALADFLHQTISDAENPWKPNPGQSFSLYQKHFRIDAKEPLKAIVVNVKRKLFDRNAGYSIDLNPMEFPKDNKIDLSDAYGLPPGAARYELQGFVWNQSGALKANGDNSGHYIAYRNINGTWYEFNDEIVTKIDKDSDPQKVRDFEERKQQLVLGLFVNIA